MAEEDCTVAGNRNGKSNTCVISILFGCFVVAVVVLGGREWDLVLVLVAVDVFRTLCILCRCNAMRCRGSVAEMTSFVVSSSFSPKSVVRVSVVAVVLDGGGG